MSSVPVGFGLPNEWEVFIKTHPVLMEKLELLFGTFHKVFIREFCSAEPADRVVFLLGRLCVEDFMEILLLCGNGYGLGGLKLLRGLYERAVTAGYIAKNPTEVETFLDYHHVHTRKYYNHAKQIFDINRRLSKEEIEDIEISYKRVESKFQESLCLKCGTKQLRNSWSSLDTASMAAKTDASLRKLYVQCFYEPTLQVHSTPSAVFSRMIEKEDGGISFDEGSQRGKANDALIGAHNVMLYVLYLQNEYFKLSLDQEISDRFADFKVAWDKSS